jgi:hypothetical protein
MDRCHACPRWSLFPWGISSCCCNRFAIHNELLPSRRPHQSLLLCDLGKDAAVALKRRVPPRRHLPALNDDVAVAGIEFHGEATAAGPLGSNRTYISSIERCQYAASIDVLERLARELGVKAAALLDDGEETA